jgi:hypothetical protein
MKRAQKGECELTDSDSSRSATKLTTSSDKSSPPGSELPRAISLDVYHRTTYIPQLMDKLMQYQEYNAAISYVCFV